MFAAEVSKAFKGVSPQLMPQVFPFKDSVSYDLKPESQFKTRSTRTEYCGRQPLIHYSPIYDWSIIWNLETATAFQCAIKKWKVESYPSR